MTDMRQHVVALLGIINDEVRHTGLHIQKGSPTDKIIVAARRAAIDTRPHDMDELRKSVENDILKGE